LKGLNIRIFIIEQAICLELYNLKKELKIARILFEGVILVAFLLVALGSFGHIYGIGDRFLNAIIFFSGYVVAFVNILIIAIYSKINKNFRNIHAIPLSITLLEDRMVFVRYDTDYIVRSKIRKSVYEYDKIGSVREKKYRIEGPHLLSDTIFKNMKIKPSKRIIFYDRKGKPLFQVDRLKLPNGKWVMEKIISKLDAKVDDDVLT